MSSFNKPTKSKKLAHHRKVIEEAAKLSIDKLDSTTSQVSLNKSGIGMISNTSNDSNTLVPDPFEDYESGKTKNKKNQSSLEDDIKMVKDLDRWG